MTGFNIFEQSIEAADKVSHMPLITICAILEDLDIGGICLQLTNETSGNTYTIHVHRADLPDTAKTAMEELLRQAEGQVAS